ncbi:tail protein [Vibrio phage D529]
MNFSNDIQLNFGLDTKVDAINSVLNAIGSVGINSPEEIDWNIDAADADRIIDNMSQSIQTNQGKGWWFNREEFHKFQPDPVNGYVTVPNNTLACYIKRQNGKVIPVTLRGHRLFDAKNLGYDMRNMTDRDGSLHCVLVVNLPFEAIPATAKHAVTNVSRFWMVNDKEGDTLKMQACKQAADTSMTGLISEDASQKRRNMMDNKFAQYQINRIGGYNNN